MNTPTPIKELIERATPGPWTIANTSDGEHLLGADDCELAFAPWHTGSNMPFIARLSPETMRLVVEALETCDTYCSDQRGIKSVGLCARRALSALNGHPPTKGEGV